MYGKLAQNSEQKRNLILIFIPEISEQTLLLFMLKISRMAKAFVY